MTQGRNQDSLQNHLLLWQCLEWSADLLLHGMKKVVIEKKMKEVDALRLKEKLRNKEGGSLREKELAGRIEKMLQLLEGRYPSGYRQK